MLQKFGQISWTGDGFRVPAQENTNTEMDRACMSARNWYWEIWCPLEQSTWLMAWFTGPFV